VSLFPSIYSIGSSGRLHKMDVSEYDSDPRGILWMWEPPSKSAAYCMGIDVAVGRTGWNRYARVAQDKKTDNGAIEIIKIGKFGKPDQQVAEWAGPVDPFDLGDVANILGRLYAGTDDDQCKCIIEVHPGPGFGTLQRMLELGYANQFRWEYYVDTVASPTKSMGWSATNRSNRDLWVKSSRHLVLNQVIPRSPWLIEEYADCRMNPEKGWAENPGGHDDRVRAFNLAIWCANGWTMNAERTVEPVSTSAEIDWQRSDCSMEEMHDGWSDTIDRMYR
jgi:hypothetical protein